MNYSQHLSLFKAFCLLGSIFLFTACGGKEDTAPPEVIKPVKYGEVTQPGGIVTKTFNGTSQSGSKTNLSFRANGLITKLSVKVGDRVKKGQLLAELDKKDIALNYEKAKASKKNARIQLDNARSSLDRMKLLYQSNSISLAEYEQAKNAFSNAQSNFETAKRSMDLQGSQFSYAKITAPTNGVISVVNSEVNEFAQAGSPILVMNSGEGDIEVNVGIPGTYINDLENGDSVKVSINGDQLDGIITEIGFSNGSTATYPITIKLTQADRNVKPGMAASATFRFGNESEGSEQLVVPVKAVGEDHEGNFAYLLVPLENHYSAQKKKITLGKLTNEGFVVTEGLKNGDKVAIAGLSSLYEGLKVNLLEQD